MFYDHDQHTEWIVVKHEEWDYSKLHMSHVLQIVTENPYLRLIFDIIVLPNAVGKWRDYRPIWAERDPAYKSRLQSVLIM